MMQAQTGEGSNAAPTVAELTARLNEMAQATGVAGSRPPTAAEIYDGLQAQRNELAQQLENLENKREELSGQLQAAPPGSAERTGLEQRVAAIDQRIVALDKQIADAEASVARAAGTPGAIVEHVDPDEFRVPEQAWMLGGMFIVVVLLPLTIAYARRIWRRGATVITALPKELMAQLGRLEQSMEAMSIEVERIGEGQRFMAKVLTDKGPRALGEGAAEPIEVKAREAERESRRR